MTRLQCLIAGALLGCTLAHAATAPCGDDLPVKGRQQVESGGLRVAFATRPWPVDVVVCTSPGGPAPDALRVDADMPAHRHGMNYRASVKPLGDGHFVAEGLMFHMPGRWRFIFDIGSGAQAERVTREVDVE
jgi:hypothetical protein